MGYSWNKLCFIILFAFIYFLRYSKVGCLYVPDK